jgi:chorismate-pyruvate lyase
MTPPSIPIVSPGSLSSAALAHPLDEFYARMEQPLPPLQKIDGQEIPQPHRQLLVHTDDMTPTLERHYRRKIHLKMLSRRRSGDEYFREVVLLLDESNEPVEFGAIKIRLRLFSRESRGQILEEQRPLGHILEEFKVRHTSRPSAYFRLASDPFINEALGLSGAQILYGRRNTLYDPQERPLAEIVEILPPVPARSRGGTPATDV